MVMKKFYFITAIAAIAAFTACQKEITPQSETVTNDTFVFSSVKPSLEEEIATKTEWNGETITWSKDDQIRMAYTVEGVWQGASDSNTAPKLYASSKLEAAAEIAEFTVNSNFTSTATGTHIFYGLYPGSISASSFDNAPVATITIPAEQTPAANSFDSAADLMVGVSEEYSAKPSSEETVLLTWSRQVAHADLTIKNLSIYDGETISNITFTAQEGADLVGLHNIDITTGAVSNAQGTTNEIVVNGNNLVYENNSVKVWLSMLPATLTELTVNVETDKAYYVRSFSGFTREFKKNMHNTMNIGMTSAVRTPKAANLGNYEESFANGQGDFTIKNVTLGSGLSYVWIYDNTYKYEKASAYVSGAAHEAVSYLISPELIIGSNKSKLTFDQAANKLNGAAVKDYFKVVVIEGETETEVAPDVYPLGTDWNFVSSTISLADYNGKTIKIGFKYTSTSSVAGTWEIKNFKVTDVKTKMSPELSFGEITEFEANVGEDFTAPTLTNPNNLTVTYSSSNENVALVDEATGEIVIGAAGVAVITASFAGNDDYNAGSASYTITVVDSSVEAKTFFYESFDSINGTGGNDNTYSGSIATNDPITDENWSVLEKVGGAKQCLKFGTGSANGIMTTDAIELTGNATLTFKAAGWASGTNTLSVTATGATLSGDTQITLINGSWKDYSITIAGATGELVLTFEGKRGFLDEVAVFTGTEPVKPIEKQDSGLAFGDGSLSYTVETGADFTAPELTNPNNLTVTYSSSNDNVAYVDENTGDILIGEEEGTAVITASFSGNDSFKEGSASYTIIVKAETTPGEGGTIATINFGSNDTKINAASVTGDDSEGNSWTITTVGTTSFTSNTEYYQVGSSKAPATSITFTTTLPTGTSVSGISAKFGGFSGTAGDVNLKVGDNIVGTGSLNAANDVIVESTSTASGNVITITVTNISKGVKVYYISVTY